MKRLLEFAEEAHRLGRSLFVAATIDGSPAPEEELLLALEDIRGVEDALVLTGRATDVTTASEPLPALLLVASLLEHRGARDIGNELVRRVHAHVGVASTVDGQSGEGGAASPEALVAVALEGARIAADTASAGGTVVHTELYELVSAAPTIVFESGELPEAFLPRPEESVRIQDEIVPHRAGRPAPVQTAPARTESRRTELDDPFAFIDTDDAALTDDRARTLTAGIAPPQEVLRAEERAQSALVDQLTAELEALRAERSHGSGDASVLERRIQKLVRQLESAEAEITELRTRLEPESGIASQYRTVQGLGADAPAEKRALLEGVFRNTLGDDAPPVDTAAAGNEGTD